MKQRMVKWIALLCAMMFALTGCSAPQSTVTSVELSEQEKAIGRLFDGNVGILKFDFQDDVQGAVMYTEVWEKDKCVETNVWSLGGTGDKELYMSWEVDREKGQSILRMNTRTEGATSVYPVMKRTVPGDNRAEWGWSWAFLDGTTGSPVALKPGETYLLGWQAFDTTPEVTENSSASTVYGVVNARERHKNQDDYTVILLMDTFATEEEALAAADRMEDAV